jgi:hypothetical protein
MAHYDAVPASPGAGDDGSGAAVLLESIRAIRATDTLTHDVIALFTDAEEAGLLGAAAFVREHPWAKDVALTMNFEGRGTNGPSLMFETGPGNLDVVRVLRSVGGARATSLSTAVYRSLPNDTDLTELAQLERPALNFAFIGGVQRYHSAEDDAAHLDPGTLQHHGNQALALTRAFANGPLPRPSTGDAVFFDLPLLGLIVYPEWLAWWLAVVALLLPIAALIAMRKREQRLLIGATLGFFLAIVFSVLAGAAAYAAGIALQRLHASIGSGAPEWSGVYALAIASLAMAIASSGYALARRWGSAFSVQTGAVIAWGVLGVALAMLLPGASFLFAWPTLLFGAALLLSASRPASRVRGPLVWLSTVLTIFILAPTLYLMFCVALGVNQVGAAALALLVSLGSTLLWAHHESMSPSRWRLPTLTGAAALIVLVVGAITVRSTRSHPTGASLIYAVDADSSTALLSGIGFSQSARTWLDRSLLGTGAARMDSAPEWAQRNVDRRSVFSAPMSIPALAPSTATVLSDSMVGGRRRVTLRVTPSRGTHTIGLRAETGSVESAEVDSRRVATDRYRRQSRQWSLSYTAPPDSGFTLTLTFPDSGALTLGILSRRIGIPALNAIEIPRRPEGILEVQDGDASLVYTRFSIAPR